jgi:hypothetical protein
MKQPSTCIPSAANSATGLQLSGEGNSATCDPTSPKSIAYLNAYCAPSSARKYRPSPLLAARAASVRAVCASASNTPAIAPNSVDMLATAKRASVDKCASPGPAHTTARSSATVLRFSTPITCRMMSLPPMPKRGSPTNSISTTSGTESQVCPVTSGSTTSPAPSPMASAPMPPAEHVCESAPITICPGCARCRANSVCIIVVLGRQ